MAQNLDNVKHISRITVADVRYLRSRKKPGERERKRERILKLERNQ